MELHELHVHQRDARLIGDPHPVGGRRIAVGRLEVHAAGAAGGEDRRLGGDQLEFTVAHVVRDHAAADAVLDGERRTEILFVDFDAETLELLPERVQDHKPGNVGRIARAGGAGAPEGALRDAAVREAGEDAAAVLKPNDLLGCVLAHGFRGILVGEIVRPLDRVERVSLGGVLLAVAERGVDAALRGAGVAAHRVHLRDDGDVGTEFRGFHRSAHAGQPATNNDDVVLDHVSLSREIRGSLFILPAGK
jgi:hypothetical protein